MCYMTNLHCFDFNILQVSWIENEGYVTADDYQTDDDVQVYEPDETQEDLSDVEERRSHFEHRIHDTSTLAAQEPVENVH